MEVDRIGNIISVWGIRTLRYKDSIISLGLQTQNSCVCMIILTTNKEHIQMHTWYMYVKCSLF